jgi:hypothetical protein
VKGLISRSAGVEFFVNHPNPPTAPLCKIELTGGDPMMTEYVVMHVLPLYHDMPGYQAAQTNREWRRTTIVRPELDPKLPSASINSNAGPCPIFEASGGRARHRQTKTLKAVTRST